MKPAELSPLPPPSLMDVHITHDPKIIENVGKLFSRNDKLLWNPMKLKISWQMDRIKKKYQKATNESIVA